VIAVGLATGISSATVRTAAKKPFAGDTLVVADWKGYGADLPWAVKDFETETGATVKFVYFDSDADEVTIIKDGGIGSIDVTLPNIAYVQLMASEGLLQPVNVNKVSDYDQLYPKLRNQPSLRYKGKIYSIPWEWGSTSLAYNPKLIKTPVTSWSALWNPKFAGKIAFYDDPQTAIETAALYLHENPYDPNLNKVRTALLALKKNAKLFWVYEDDFEKAWTTGAVSIGNAFSTVAGVLITSHVPLVYVIPKEGTVGWLDTWAIVKDAPNPALAYRWLEFMSSTNFQRLVSYSGEAAGPANMIAASELTPAGVKLTEAPPALLNRLVLQIKIPPARLQAWTQLWAEVKAS
jgi:spermidine/putrescine-binding protein